MGLVRLPGVPVNLPTPADVLALPAAAGRLLDDVAALLERIEGTRAEADALVRRTEETRARADEMLAGTEGPIGRLTALLEGLEPPLTALQPVLDRLAETTEPHEVDAMVALIDQLPLLAEKMETDVVPVLEGLGSVAPDLHDLLDTSRELNEMLAKLPGMGRVKERVEERQADEGRG